MSLFLFSDSLSSVFVVLWIFVADFGKGKKGKNHHFTSSGVAAAPVSQAPAAAGVLSQALLSCGG
jgi:hypothetical protein